jgi:hypothetical protein
MKQFLVSASALILATYASVASAAPETPFYVGVLLGDSTLDIQSRAHIDNEPTVPNSYDFEAQDSQTLAFMASGGYRFTDLIGVEVQYTTSLVSDRVYGAVKVNNSSKSQMDSSISALGVYAVFQGGEDAYVRGKIGIGQATAAFDTDFANVTFSSMDLSYGVAVGQKLGSLGSVELTYMRYPDIKVSRQKFADDFRSTPAYDSYTTVRRDLTLEVLMVGYVFQF